MTKRISKKECTNLVKLGRETAERACTDETDVETANDVIEFPECYVNRLYPYCLTSEESSEARFEIFKNSFLEWVSDTYDSSRVR